MTPSYIARLLLLSSTLFFLAQLLVGALVAYLTPTAIRRSLAMDPHRAARFLLSLRLTPTAFSLLLVAALCVPSYLRFEPRGADEEVGIVCLAGAILGAFLGGLAVYRAARGLRQSAAFVRRSGGRESSIDGTLVWIVPRNMGLALAGIRRPRLLISELALRELSAEELNVALRHERAHRTSHDNFKRLLVLLAPSIFPGLRNLEETWIKCAEWAADDRASDGDAVRSASLAGALVRVARLQSATSMPPLVTSLVEADEDLSLRVDRLLQPAPAGRAGLRAEAIALTAAAMLILAVAINPGSLQIVHHLLEWMID